MSRLPNRLFYCVTLCVGATLACQAANAWLPFGSAPTATPAILADCFWSADAFAWIDANGNGARDEGEAPLAGVSVNFSLTFFSGATTDAAGLAHISGMHPGACDPSLPNSLVAIAPAGFAPTTELSLPFTEERTEYAFGFAPAP